MSEPQPPCWCCGAEPRGETWPMVAMHRTGDKKAIVEWVEGDADLVPWTYCPTCQARLAGQHIEVEPPPVDDITHAREAFAMLQERYPRLVAQLHAIVGRIEQVMAAPPTPGPLVMPEDWAVPTGELLRLVAVLLDDLRIAALATAVDALVERSFTDLVFAQLTPESISARFGTTRMPPAAAHAIIEFVNGQAEPKIVPMATPLGGEAYPEPIVVDDDDDGDD